MELTKEEILVLKTCDEEPGTVENIAIQSKLDKKKVKNILKELEKKKLVYLDNEISKEWWCATYEGTKQLEKLGL